MSSVGGSGQIDANCCVKCNIEMLRLDSREREVRKKKSRGVRLIKQELID